MEVEEIGKDEQHKKALAKLEVRSPIHPPPLPSHPPTHLPTHTLQHLIRTASFSSTFPSIRKRLIQPPTHPPTHSIKNKQAIVEKGWKDYAPLRLKELQARRQQPPNKQERGMQEVGGWVGGWMGG